jgi:hypothetical protein
VHCSKPKKEQWVTTNAENYPIDSVIGLLSANLENVSPIRESLVQGLRRYLHDPETSAPAAELGLNLRQRGRGEPGADPGAEIEQALLQEEGQRLRQIAETESGVACDLVVLEQLSVANFLSIHGLDAFFNHRLYWLFPQSGRVPLADLIFGGLLWGASTGVSLQFLLRSLKEVGDVLEASTPPWYKPSDRWFAGSAWGFDYRRDTGAPRLEDVTSLDAPEKFALVGIAAAAAEEAQALDDSRGVSGLADLLENAPSDAAVWTAIAPIFRAKLQLASLEEGLAALADLGLPEGGRRLLERWLEGGEPLVELASPDSIEDV